MHHGIKTIEGRRDATRLSSVLLGLMECPVQQDLGGIYCQNISTTSNFAITYEICLLFVLQFPILQENREFARKRWFIRVFNVRINLESAPNNKSKNLERKIHETELQENIFYRTGFLIN